MAAATAIQRMAAPSTPRMMKRVKFCDDAPRVFHITPYENFEVSRSLLFYSPQEILKFQDERFEEEAAALEQKRAEEAKARKAEKEEKKKQRKERLQAKREARKKKNKEEPSREATATSSSGRSKSRRTKDIAATNTPTTTIAPSTSTLVPVTSSDDDLMSSSSESEELLPTQELPQTPVQSPHQTHHRPFPRMDLDEQSPCARRHSFPKNIAALAEAVAAATTEEADASAGGARVVTPSPTQQRSKKQQNYRRSARSDLSSVSCKLHLPPLASSPPLALSRAASAPTASTTSSIPTPDSSLPRDTTPINTPQSGKAQEQAAGIPCNSVDTIEEEPQELVEKGETVEDENDDNVMDPLLPRPSTATAATATSEITETETTALTSPTTALSSTTAEQPQEMLQRNLQRWKQSTLFLFGLLVLSWLYFSLGTSSSSSSNTTAGAIPPPPSTPSTTVPRLNLRGPLTAASVTANPLLLDRKPTATTNQRR